MTEKKIRRAPYTFTIHLTDWGWKAFGEHDYQGDLSLIDTNEHNPPLTDGQEAALWNLIDEVTFDRKADAERAVRDWLRLAPPSASSP